MIIFDRVHSWQEDFTKTTFCLGCSFSVKKAPRTKASPSFSAWDWIVIHYRIQQTDTDLEHERRSRHRNRNMPQELTLPSIMCRPERVGRPVGITVACRISRSPATFSFHRDGPDQRGKELCCGAGTLFTSAASRDGIRRSNPRACLIV